jgi:hypothetical protein
LIYQSRYASTFPAAGAVEVYTLSWATITTVVGNATTVAMRRFSGLQAPIYLYLSLEKCSPEVLHFASIGNTRAISASATHPHTLTRRRSAPTPRSPNSLLFTLQNDGIGAMVESRIIRTHIRFLTPVILELLVEVLHGALFPEVHHGFKEEKKSLTVKSR